MAGAFEEDLIELTTGEGSILLLLSLTTATFCKLLETAEGAPPALLGNDDVAAVAELVVVAGAEAAVPDLLYPGFDDDVADVVDDDKYDAAFAEVTEEDDEVFLSLPFITFAGDDSFLVAGAVTAPPFVGAEDPSNASLLTWVANSTRT